MNDIKPSCYCAAHGCNQLGTVTSSTSGSTEWWCFLHFGKEAARLQAVTVEVCRREWLSRAITDIRMHYYTDRWGDTFKAVQHELAMNQRNDLKISDKDKTVWQWVRRLEGALAAMVHATPETPQHQARMDIAEPTQEPVLETA